MLRILPRSQGNVVGLECNGKITRADYLDVLIPKFNEIIAEHGKARALIDFSDDFSGYELDAIIEDIRYGAKHMGQLEKIALINAPFWMRALIKVYDKLSKCNCRAFDKRTRDEAWSFIEG